MEQTTSKWTWWATVQESSVAILGSAHGCCVSSSCNFLGMQVSTQDGHLICRHDITLDSSTDVGEHPEFASRRLNFMTPVLGSQ